MKKRDAAARIIEDLYDANKTMWPSELATRIRRAIAVARRKERERSVKCVQAVRDKSWMGAMTHESFVCANIIEAIKEGGR